MTELAQLMDVMTNVSRSYAIWYEIVRADRFNERERMFRDHADFFGPTVDSHFGSCCIGISILFDKHRRASSLAKYLDSIADKTLIKKVNANLNPIMPIIDRIASLRKNVYAHRNRVGSPDEFFDEASLTPAIIGSVIGTCEHVFDDIERHFSPNIEESFVLRVTRRVDLVREDTKLIIEALRNAA